MSVLICRFLKILSAFAAACILAACATTNTGTEDGVSAESEIPAQVESDPAELVEPLTEEAETLQTETQTQMDPAPSALEADAAPDSVTTGSARTDVVEGVAVFPDQPYEIEDPLEIEEPLVFETDSDAEVDRLRDELAASESELERSRALEAEQARSRALEAELARNRARESEMERSRALEAELERSRAREAERDFASEQAGSASADSGDMDAASDEQDSDPPVHTTMAQASEDPAPGASGRASDVAGKPTEFSIYFGFNQATLEREFESDVVMHAEYLKENPNLMVEIQGNCDERGSREYNIALGERRAYTVKRALELLGIDGRRIQTVSFGAEKPIAFGHDEASWRLNRRADILY